MQIDESIQQANADIGGYILAKYGAAGVLRAADAVCALGALAGVFAQAQARALLAAGVLENTQSSLIEVRTSDGGVYYFGDAINTCLLDGAPERPAFWNIAAGAAQNPDIGDVIDVEEIARNTAASLGSEAFGKPRIDARYPLSETPIGAVRAHALPLLAHFKAIGVDPAKLMLTFGLTALGLASLASGALHVAPIDCPMDRTDIVRLYMEAAAPMSKLDLRALGMAG